jgi:hypothetical protein
MTPESRSTRAGQIDPTELRAPLFDLDGVITRTATIHASAWQCLLDDFLQRWGEQTIMSMSRSAFRTIIWSTSMASAGMTASRPSCAPAKSRSTGSIRATARTRPQCVASATRRIAISPRSWRRGGVEVYDDAVTLIATARRRPTPSSKPRRCLALRPRRLPCSKTRSRACRRGERATSGLLSVSTEEPAPTFSAVVRTSSARTYPSCWDE